MRVLHVSAYYAPAYVYGGPPRSIHALCRALRREGVDAQVFTTDANGSGRLPASVTGGPDFAGVPVRYFARGFPRWPIGSRPLGAALRDEIGGYDAVHVHGLWNRVVWAAAREARRAGVPYVLSPRGMLEPAARAHRAWRKRASWTLADRHVVAGASLLHATSEAERATLAEASGGIPVVCLPNGIEPVPVPARAAGDRPLVLFMGRVHPIKRLDLLVRAFAMVRARHPRARLAIAGPDESGLVPALRTLAGRHDEAVRWIGSADDDERRALLGEATVLVMCSDAESFGMSVLEALAAAVPVVVTRTCPWADVERHGAGFWVEQDAEAIAAAVVRVLDDPAAARAMGDRGRLLAESAYGWTAIARAFAAEYERLAAPRAASLPVPALS